MDSESWSHLPRPARESQQLPLTGQHPLVKNLSQNAAREPDALHVPAVSMPKRALPLHFANDSDDARIVSSRLLQSVERPIASRTIKRNSHIQAIGQMPPGSSSSKVAIVAERTVHNISDGDMELEELSAPVECHISQNSASELDVVKPLTPVNYLVVHASAPEGEIVLNTLSADESNFDFQVTDAAIAKEQVSEPMAPFNAVREYSAAAGDTNTRPISAPRGSPHRSAMANSSSSELGGESSSSSYGREDPNSSPCNTSDSSSDTEDSSNSEADEGIAGTLHGVRICDLGGKPASLLTIASQGPFNAHVRCAHGSHNARVLGDASEATRRVTRFGTCYAIFCITEFSCEYPRTGHAVIWIHSATEKYYRVGSVAPSERRIWAHVQTAADLAGYVINAILNFPNCLSSARSEANVDAVLEDIRRKMGFAELSDLVSALTFHRAFIRAQVEQQDISGLRSHPIMLRLINKYWRHGLSRIHKPCPAIPIERVCISDGLVEEGKSLSVRANVCDTGSEKSKDVALLAQPCASVVSVSTPQSPTREQVKLPGIASLLHTLQIPNSALNRTATNAVVPVSSERVSAGPQHVTLRPVQSTASAMSQCDVHAIVPSSQRLSPEPLTSHALPPHALLAANAAMRFIQRWKGIADKNDMVRRMKAALKYASIVDLRRELRPHSKAIAAYIRAHNLPNAEKLYYLTMFDEMMAVTDVHGRLVSTARSSTGRPCDSAPQPADGTFHEPAGHSLDLSKLAMPSSRVDCSQKAPTLSRARPQRDSDIEMEDGDEDDASLFQHLKPSAKIQRLDLPSLVLPPSCNSSMTTIGSSPLQSQTESSVPTTNRPPHRPANTTDPEGTGSTVVGRLGLFWDDIARSLSRSSSQAYATPSDSNEVFAGASVATTISGAYSKAGCSGNHSLPDAPAHQSSAKSDGTRARAQSLVRDMHTPVPLAIPKIAAAEFQLMVRPRPIRAEFLPPFVIQLPVPNDSAPSARCPFCGIDVFAERSCDAPPLRELLAMHVEVFHVKQHALEPTAGIGQPKDLRTMTKEHFQAQMEVLSWPSRKHKESKKAAEIVIPLLAPAVHGGTVLAIDAPRIDASPTVERMQATRLCSTSPFDKDSKTSIHDTIDEGMFEEETLAARVHMEAYMNPASVVVEAAPACDKIALVNRDSAMQLSEAFRNIAEPAMAPKDPKLVRHDQAILPDGSAPVLDEVAPMLEGQVNSDDVEMFRASADHTEAERHAFVANESGRVAESPETRVLSPSSERQHPTEPVGVLDIDGLVVPPSRKHATHYLQEFSPRRSESMGPAQRIAPSTREPSLQPHLDAFASSSYTERRFTPRCITPPRPSPQHLLPLTPKIRQVHRREGGLESYECEVRMPHAGQDVPRRVVAGTDASTVRLRIPGASNASGAGSGGPTPKRPKQSRFDKYRP